MNVTIGNMILFAVFLLLSCQMKVFAGSTAVTHVFVQKGHDVLLEVKKDDVPEEFVLFLWKFREDILVTFTPKSEPTVTKRYTGRVEFSVENYSVKLKNLQETDSGLYTARVTGDKDQTVSKYNVTVQDPVSPVNLTVDSVSRSTNLCNLTVTCRTQDFHISSTFTCDNQTCSQEGGERSKVTASGASLQVYLVNDSIICNHSNQVSWTKNQEQTKIRDSCLHHDDPVSPVVLTVDSVFNSTNPCNLTVTCRTQDSHISSTFTCDTQTCSQEEGERSKVTASGASLQVYLVNDSIICNHSNQVSWTKNQEQTKSWNFCPRHDGSSNGAITTGAVASVVAAVVVAGLLFVWFQCKRPIEQKNKENTIYAVPEDIVPGQNRIQTPAEDVSTVSPTSTYALVQFHTGPEKSQNTMNSS
ncbi:uncharacterized protein [Channa argus]|uniref:uncharacterized protein isoform X1 n=2 Tax=Channa argus TaxID=215402 RepID=UPI00351F88C4